MPEITNTSKVDPIIHLAMAMGDKSDPNRSHGDFILDMEARGQRQLVESSLLPAEADWPQFEALGFVKGEPVEGDELFVHATLPTGWTKRASDHSMWSYIYDIRGVKRVGIFYKAAFYDRRASMSLVNVGRHLATDIIYGDAPTVALPEHWEQLTLDEKADFQCSIDAYLADNETHPEIFGDRASRAQTLNALINA